MHSSRPAKTLADYLVIAVSPVLIMVLVGSLVFFLLQVFYRGDTQAGLRWVLFWFVLAIVLVARIGIEQGPGYGSLYGLALAGATWFYLAMLYPGYLLGIVLLSLVWWSANRLTWDCTLIDEDEDASGQGLLEVAAQKSRALPPEEDPATTTTNNNKPLYSRTLPGKRPIKDRPRPPHTPGLWVVYFSLAALPLFGLGHVLIPASEAASRQRGFLYLFAYLAAALGLLLTTSFLGLRRYLRQRRLPMPPAIALGWIRSGMGVAVVVMALALFMPRPGADYTWKTLARQADHYLRKASQYATPPNPPGQGREGTPARQKSSENANEANRSPAPQENTPGEGGRLQTEFQDQTAPATPASQAAPASPAAPGEMYFLLKRLVLLAAALWLGWWLFRQRHVILQALQALWRAILQFFRDLLDLRPRLFIRKTKSMGEKPVANPKSFAAYKNPFLSRKEQVWPPEQIIAYSFEAVQAWAREQGWAPRPDQTPREICATIEEQFPQYATGMRHLARLYDYAAYGRQVPTETAHWEPLRQLWRDLTQTSSILR